MNDFYALTINNITHQTKDAVVISLEIPSKLKEDFKFIAGQYIVIKFKINQKEIRRSYSICATPNAKFLKIAIKALKGGLFSNYANTKLKVGDKLKVSKPQGKFILKTNYQNEKNYLAFAAGSGITPIMAMIYAVLQEEPKSKFVLVYANKTELDILFKSELQKLKQDYPNQFFIQYIFSRAHVAQALFGRIDKGIINYSIKNKFKTFKFDSYYICGPEGMLKTVKESLLALNVPLDSIYFELFIESKSKNKVSATSANAIIILDDENFKISVKQKQSILEAALAAGIDAPYSCKGGVCASCMAKITSGKAKMIKNMVLTDEEISEGFVLTCQAHPTTKELTVDYDEN